MDALNENNQIERINLSDTCQNTLYGLLMLQCYPIKKDFPVPEWKDLPYKLTRVKTKDGKDSFIYSTHVNHVSDSSKYLEMIIHMNENFEVYAYLVSFQMVNE